MFQKGLRLMMLVGTLLFFGLVTTLIIRECESSDSVDNTEMVVEK